MSVLDSVLSVNNNIRMIEHAVVEYSMITSCITQFNPIWQFISKDHVSVKVEDKVITLDGKTYNKEQFVSLNIDLGNNRKLCLVIPNHFVLEKFILNSFMEWAVEALDREYKLWQNVEQNRDISRVLSIYDSLPDEKQKLLITFLTSTAKRKSIIKVDHNHVNYNSWL